MAELGIPENNPAWTKAAPASEFQEFPTPYSSMILPGFDEEYVNRPNEDEDVLEPILVHDVAPTNKAANLEEETGETIAKVFGERFVEETGRDDREDAS